MPPRDEARPRLSPAETRTGFWLFAGHLLTVWGLALSNVFAGSVILWSLVKARRLPWSWPRLAPLLAPAAIYGVVFAVSALTSSDVLLSLGELRDLLTFATLLLAPLLVRGESAVRRLVDAFLVMVSLLAVHGMGQYYLSDEYGDLHRRIVGLFSHYQTFAGVLLIGALALAARLATGRREHRVWVWAAFLVVVWTLLLSLTRGAWVAAAAVLIVLSLVRAKRILVAVVAVTVVLAVLAPGPLVERVRSIADLEDPSNYDRLCMAEAAFFMIEERPLFGIGPGMARELYPIYRHPTAPRITVPHLHNSFLQRAAEQGLVPSAAYLALMGAALVLAARAYRREGGADGPRADLHLATILVVIGFNVAGLFEDNWSDTEVRRLVLFFLALPLCLQAPSLEAPDLEASITSDLDDSDEDLDEDPKNTPDPPRETRAS